jgi:hypothetical protein
VPVPSTGITARCRAKLSRSLPCPRSGCSRRIIG